VKKPALTLLLLLGCAPACFGENSPVAATLEAQPAYSNNPVVATISEDRKLQTLGEASGPSPAEASTPSDWSPFLVIAAGIVGLVWVRRHVIDL
jgi:hypothetical protein